MNTLRRVMFVLLVVLAVASISYGLFLHTIGTR